MASTTALAYQMMIEEKYMNAAINAEQRGNYYVASMYLLTHAKFVGMTDLPDRPMNVKTHEAHLEQYQKFYFDLLLGISEKASTTLAEVRKKYGNKGLDLPKVNK